MKACLLELLYVLRADPNFLLRVKVVSAIASDLEHTRAGIRYI
jgi:hypothetical protein